MLPIYFDALAAHRLGYVVGSLFSLDHFVFARSFRRWIQRRPRCEFGSAKKMTPLHRVLGFDVKLWPIWCGRMFADRRTVAEALGP